MAKLKLPKRDVTTLVSKNLFKVKSFTQTIKDAQKIKIPKMLFDELIFETDLTVIFSSTNIGKTMLAIQIADSISRGKIIYGFKNEAEPQKVLYCDFELSEKQFEGRYCEKINGEWFNHYDWHENLKRVTFDLKSEGKITAENILISIKECVKEQKAKVVVIDNIYWINDTGLENSKDAGKLMKYLKLLKNEKDLTIIVLAHTPKKYKWSPMHKTDLAGSARIGDFVDAITAINYSKEDSNYRYLIQLKSRFTEKKYHSNNVITTKITKVEPNFTGFEFIEPTDENRLEEYHLESKTITEVYSQETIETNKEKAIEIIKEKPDISSRNLGFEIGVSHQTANKYLKNHR